MPETDIFTNRNNGQHVPVLFAPFLQFMACSGETLVRCSTSILRPPGEPIGPTHPEGIQQPEFHPPADIKENAVASASAVVESLAITVVLLSPSSAQPVAGLMTCE